MALKWSPAGLDVPVLLILGHWERQIMGFRLLASFSMSFERLIRYPVCVRGQPIWCIMGLWKPFSPTSLWTSHVTSSCLPSKHITRHHLFINIWVTWALTHSSSSNSSSIPALFSANSWVVYPNSYLILKKFITLNRHPKDIKCLH